MGIASFPRPAGGAGLASSPTVRAKQGPRRELHWRPHTVTTDPDADSGRWHSVLMIELTADDVAGNLAQAGLDVIGHA